jgi:hypothetical protein
MVTLAQLWLPILASTVAVFFISLLMWMFMPHHKRDWSPATDEDGLMDHVRGQHLGQRQITFPHCSDPAQMKDPAFMEKHAKGPKGFLILLPDGPMNMGKSMGISGAYNLVCAASVAYVATLGLEPTSPSSLVFRFVSTVAFLTFGAGLGWGAIWFGRTWSSTLKEMGDALVYGLATGAVFMWLWPAVG